MHELASKYKKLLSKASRLETLDIMVRKQAKDLGIVYTGGDEYLRYAAAAALAHSEAALSLFNAAYNQFERIKEKEIEVLRPGDLFE